MAAIRQLRALPSNAQPNETYRLLGPHQIYLTQECTTAVSQTQPSAAAGRQLSLSATTLHLLTEVLCVSGFSQLYTNTKTEYLQYKQICCNRGEDVSGNTTGPQTPCGNSHPSAVAAASQTHVLFATVSVIFMLLAHPSLPSRQFLAHHHCSPQLHDLFALDSRVPESAALTLTSCLGTAQHQHQKSSVPRQLCIQLIPGEIIYSPSKSTGAVPLFFPPSFPLPASLLLERSYYFSLMLTTPIPCHCHCHFWCSSSSFSPSTSIFPPISRTNF